MNINQLRDEVHKNAVNHGFWEKEKDFGMIIALIHSELSEALEEYRNGHSPKEIYYDYRSGYNKPEGIPIELADVIIRVLDYCGKENIDIENAINIKHQYNKSRPYKHNKKV